LDIFALFLVKQLKQFHLKSCFHGEQGIPEFNYWLIHAGLASKGTVLPMKVKIPLLSKAFQDLKLISWIFVNFFSVKTTL